MQKRLVSFALALAVLCQTALCLAFGPFSTINNGGASTLNGLGTNPDPLLPNEKWRQGAVVTPVSNLAANTEAYVASVRDWFRWDPSSTATADDITVVSLTANGGSAGRFLREFRGDPYWRAQTAWFVDTAGNDENDGSSLAPVKTDAEIQRRWGLGIRARLTVPVTITYAQAPTGQTNLLFEIVTGGALTFIGTPTISKAGTVLTAVQAQVRTAGAEAGWAIMGTGLGATEVGKLAFITASGTPANVNAYAAVLKDETGGKLRVSPFGTSTVSAFTQATPQVGDVIEIRDMSTLKVGAIEGTSAMQDAAAISPDRNAVIFDSVALDGGGQLGSVFINGLTAVYQRSRLTNLSFTGISRATAQSHRVNGGIVTGTNGLAIRSTVTFNQTGFLGTNTGASVGSGGALTLSADCYFQNSGLAVARGAVALSSGSGFFDRGTSNATVVVSGGGFYLQSGAVPDWGTANTGHGVTISSCGSYAYTTKPTINSGLGAGREAQVGGTDKLYSAVPYIEATNNAALVLNQ
jgi:hypothetical protein